VCARLQELQRARHPAAVHARAAHMQHRRLPRWAPVSQGRLQAEPGMPHQGPRRLTTCW